MPEFDAQAKRKSYFSGGKMNHKRLLFVLVGMVLVILSLAACNSAASDAPKFPTGKFISADDKYLGYYFNEDKTWTYFYYGEYGAEGTYSVKGNQWIEKGTEECPFPGTYEWTFDGANLTFKLVGEDQCDPRREATDGVTFILTK
jgi:hypothetical protein